MPTRTVNIHVSGRPTFRMPLPATEDDGRLSVSVGMDGDGAHPIGLFAADLAHDRVEIGTWPEGEEWTVAHVIDVSNPSPNRMTTPDLSKSAWRDAVMNDETSLGYVDWKNHMYDEAWLARMEGVMASRPDVVAALRDLFDNADFDTVASEYVRAAVELAALILGLSADYANRPGQLAAALLDRPMPAHLIDGK